MGQSLSDSHLSENNENIHMNIQIEKVHAYIENKVTKIEENSISVLKYKTPYFRYICLFMSNIIIFSFKNFFHLKSICKC